MIITSDYIWQHADWPQWRWSEGALQPALTAVQVARTRLLDQLSLLDDEHRRQVEVELYTRETASTSAIEGVQVDPAAARSSIVQRPDRINRRHGRTSTGSTGATGAQGPTGLADRLNAGIVSEALTMGNSVEALNVGGSQRAALSGLIEALSKVQSLKGDVLLLAADARKTRAVSAQELDFGDGAAAVRRM